MKYWSFLASTGAQEMQIFVCLCVQSLLVCSSQSSSFWLKSSTCSLSTLSSLSQLSLSSLSALAKLPLRTLSARAQLSLSTLSELRGYFISQSVVKWFTFIFIKHKDMLRF